MRVAVLGAGLQGTTAALELARRGVEVDLLEQDPLPLNRASLRNEGKIHLGLVYANDPTLATARTMLDGALSFASLLDGWTSGRTSSVARSAPFTYLVSPESALGPDDLEHYYHAVEEEYRARRAAEPHLRYLGEAPDGLVRRVPAECDAAVAAFATEERAVDVAMLARLLTDAVSAERAVRFRPGLRVTAVERTHHGFRVEGAAEAGTWRGDYDQVVNALWEHRLGIDRQLGVEPEHRWVNRLKYRVLVRLPEALRDRRSVTVVLGAFGDVVVHPDGTAYVSWYPACRRGWSEEVDPPAAWDDACRGQVPEAVAEEIATEALVGSEPWFPGIGEAVPFHVDAGVIFAWGATDITDGSSHLHRRDEIGVRSTDGYHTVDTGKLTTAPLFAVRVADLVEDGPATRAVS